MPLWVVRGRGTFGRQVAAGAVEAARSEGLEVVEARAGDGFSFEDAPELWDLFSAGRFEDDVAIVKAAWSAARPPRVIGSVAAGVQGFGSEVGYMNGVYGIGQWFPGRGDAPALGPAESEFLAAYSDVAEASPDYPAVQAVAGAVLATRCAELAGTLDRSALWEAAAGLATSTLFGEFKIDPTTGAQIKHTPVLVRWQDGALRLAQ